MSEMNWDLIWRALADPTRRQLLDLLVTGPKTTGQLAESIPGLSRYAIMKHLGILEKATLVTVRRRGRHRWNYLNQIPLRAIYERWLIRFMEPAAANLLSLKRHVERPSERAHENPEDHT